jgi:NitT/TauT family transport system substrate-binding protein
MKKKVIRLLTVILCISMMLSMLASCSNNQGNSERGYEASVIRLNYNLSYTASAVLLLKLTGILEELLPDDVSVEWTGLEGNTNVRDALAADRIDIGALNTTTFINAIANDLPIMVLSNYAVQTGVIYSARPDIQSLDDIQSGDKGATQSVGNVYHIALMLHALRTYGDAGKFDANLIAMSNSDMLSSVMTSNELSWIMLGFPATKRADLIDGLTPIFDMTQIIKDNNMGITICTNNNFNDRNPVLVEILYDAIEQVIDFMNNNPSEAARLLAEVYEDIYAADIEEQIRTAPPQLEMSESAYNTVAELMYEVGIIPNPPRLFSELPNYDRIPKVD